MTNRCSKAIVEAKKAGNGPDVANVYFRTLEKLYALNVRGIGKAINNADWVLVEDDLVEPAKIILKSNTGQQSLNLKPYLFEITGYLKVALPDGIDPRLFQ